jgi:predicted DsbA family dithiol-disulfide isomerase
VVTGLSDEALEKLHAVDPHSAELIKLRFFIGLRYDEAAEALRERRYRTSVDADWAKSRAYGVTGVPTFVSGGRGVVGAQSYEVLVQLVDQGNAMSRTDRDSG